MTHIFMVRYYLPGTGVCSCSFARSAAVTIEKRLNCARASSRTEVRVRRAGMRRKSSSQRMDWVVKERVGRDSVCRGRRMFCR